MNQKALQAAALLLYLTCTELRKHAVIYLVHSNVEEAALLNLLNRIQSKAKTES